MTFPGGEKIQNIIDNHDPDEFKIGDLVEVTGWTDHWNNYVGRIIKIDEEYCYVEPRITDPYSSSGYGFRSKMLTLTLPEEELAISILGEDYFA